ncbi:hypothetical protein [Amycolatopsis silviterrae]|uniref:DUF4190 domain-containing protein n=1 Tax=Amycolatopsis silviterrae TaxID=1656914 RepID=A0ABW5HHZ3_9PSEU
MTAGPPEQQPPQWPAQPPMPPQYPGYAPYPPVYPPAPAPANGVWLGTAALVLGLLGCVVPLLPIDLTGIRAYLALPFGLAGLACGIAGLVGRRTGKPLSATGVAVSAIALVLGVVMLGNLVAG